MKGCFQMRMIVAQKLYSALLFVALAAISGVCDAAYQGPDRTKLRIGAYFLRPKNCSVTESHVRDLK